MVALNSTYNKNKFFKTIDYWSRDMLNFDFSEKGLRIVSPPNFVHNFSRKMFLILNSVNWPNRMPDSFYFLRYWSVSVLQLFVNQVVTSQIFNQAVFLHHQKVMAKLKYLENEKKFCVVLTESVPSKSLLQNFIKISL